MSPTSEWAGRALQLLLALVYVSAAIGKVVDPRGTHEILAFAVPAMSPFVLALTAGLIAGTELALGAWLLLRKGPANPIWRVA